MKSVIFSSYRDFGNNKRPFASNRYLLGAGIIGADLYLINDSYLTDLAAGSVDGTQAEPTGGERNVLDGESGISISGGFLEFAGQAVTPSFGEQSVYYPSVQRELGLTVLFNANFENTNQSLLGFDTDEAGTVVEYAFYPVGTTLFIYITGSLKDVGIGAILDASYRNLAISTRENGAFFFLAGKLVYATETSGDSTLYVGLATLTQEMSVGYTRVPVSTLSFLPHASDGFSTDGETDGLGHAETSGGSGVSYTDQEGTGSVSGGVYSADSLGGSTSRHISTVSCPDNVYIELDIESVAVAEAGIAARYEDSDNLLLAYHDGTNVVLDEIVSGTPNNLISSAVAYVQSARIALRVDGTNARLFYNDALVGTATIDGGLTSDNAGMYFDNTSDTVDNLVIWDVDGASSYLARYE